MKAIFWVTVQGTPIYRNSSKRKPGRLQIRKSKPATEGDEIAMRFELEIPDSLFAKPSLDVRASIPEGDAGGPVITTEVAADIAEAIRRQTGMTVHIGVPASDAEAASDD